MGVCEREYESFCIFFLLRRGVTWGVGVVVVVLGVMEV